MGCGASTAQLQHIERNVKGIEKDVKSIEKPVKEVGKKEKKEKKKEKKRSRSSSSSSSSSDDSSDDERNNNPGDVITKTLLRDYLNREINMLKLELIQPEVVLKQLLEEKNQNTQQLITASLALEQQRQISIKEYQDLANLQLLIQQRRQVNQDTWDTEQREYVEAYNKHKQLEESHVKLEEIGKQLTEKIKVASDDVQKLLKLRERQDHILIKAFDGSYGSEREASIEEYVDKMKEFRKNILNTKTQWERGLGFTKQSNIQFWRAIQVWSTILNQGHPHLRWQYCSVVANYLQAAYGNSVQAVNCMRAHTQIPYFTPKMFREVETSRRNAYNASQPRFHSTYLQWLWYYQQNSAYLEKWIEKTLNQTIEGDLTKVNGYLTVAEADLRAERKRLIISKVKEKFGDNVESEVAQQEAEVDRLSKEVSKLKKISIQANVITVPVNNETENENETQGPPPAAGRKSDPDLTTDQRDKEVSVNLATDPDGGLGIELTSRNDGIYVARLLHKGSATKDGSILAGDKIVSINGVSLDGKSVEEATELLKEGVSNVVIVIIRMSAPESDGEDEEAKKRHVEAQAAEEESRKRLEEAKAKIAALESATDILEKEKKEAEDAAQEAELRRKAEEEAGEAKLKADEAAANAAVEQKDQMLKEAEEAAKAVEQAKAEAAKWSQMAEDAAKKARTEEEALAKAAEERAIAEKEADVAEEGARRAKEELDRITAAAAQAEEAKENKAKVAKETAQNTADSKPAAADEPAPDFKSDIDNIMNDYRASVDQYNKKRGTEETRMDLDLQEKLRARRQKRRQQMKQKLEEQRLLAAKEDGKVANE